MLDSGAGSELRERLVELHSREGEREFSLLGSRWDLYPGVFAPSRTPATGIFTSWIPFPSGGSFLEMGCGAGVTAVTAAKRGCASVTAVDICIAAVRNTEANVRRHGVGERTRVVHSDMFDALPPDERFDVIFWNSNLIEAPASVTYHRDIERAIFDPGYLAHDHYLRVGRTRLTEHGRLLLGFSSLGNARLLNEIARRYDLRPERIRARTYTSAVGVEVELQLLDLQRRAGH